MKFIYHQVSRSILVLAAFALSACAYTTDGTMLSPITTRAPVSPPSVEYTVGDFSYSLEGGKLVSSSFVGSALNTKIMDAWKNRRYVRDAQSVDAAAFTGHADYNVTLTGSQYGVSSVGMQILSGLTLFLIPYTVTQHYDLQYMLTDTKTGKKYSASVQEANDTDVELFLLFALPFSQDGQNAMLERVGDHLYDQLYRQGAFHQSTATHKSTVQ
jgi:hypothetical protein